MINKNDYEKRFTSYLKFIQTDGMTMKNILEVFTDMNSEIERLQLKYERMDRDYRFRIDEIEKEHRENLTKEVEKKLAAKDKYAIDKIKGEIWIAMKKFIDKELISDVSTK